MRNVILSLSFLFSLQLLIAQTPSIIHDIPAESFACEEFCYTVDFQNLDPAVGYQPYLRLVLPPDLDLASINFAAGPGNIVLNEIFGADGELEDPLIEEIVMGQLGCRLVVYEMPVGSVVQNGPLLETTICLKPTPTATIGGTFPVEITPIFRFGDTATNNNGPIIGTAVTASVTTLLYQYRKEVLDYEGENPPGSSYPMRYQLILDVAEGKTITNLQFQDILSSKLQFAGNQTITGGNTCTFDQVPSMTSPGGTLTASCSNVTGTADNEDLIVEYDAYIIDALNHSNCATCPVENNSSFSSSSGLTIDGDVVTTARHVTMQKNASPSSNVVPENTVTYTIHFQVSDNDVVDFLEISDLVADGQTTPIAANMQLIVGGSNVPITPTITHNSTTGISSIFVDVHAAYGQDLVGPIQGQLIYTVQINQAFEATGQQVLANDGLNETATLVYSTGPNNGSNCSITDDAPIKIAPITIHKEIVNQQTEYEPGDIITYRIWSEIPSGDSREVNYIDYFPLPVLNIANFTPDWGNNVRYVTGNGWMTGAVPTITKNIPTNSIEFYWPFIYTSGAGSLGIEIDVPITVEPFADGLFHSNVLEVETSNTSANTATESTLVLIDINAPNLTMNKVITASSNPNSGIANGGNNLNNADAGDIISFQVEVENIGGAEAYDVFVQDIPPAGFGNCMLTSVTRGNGTTPITYTGDLFTTGITFTQTIEDAAQAGSTQENKAFVNYQCTCETSVVPQTSIVNTASVNWASAAGATDFPTLTDDATTTIRRPGINKTILGIDPNYTGQANTVQIGEIVTYRVRLTIPEGTSPNTFLSDVLDSGLEMVDIVSVTPNTTDITTDLVGGFASIVATNVIGQGNFNISFGNITNTNTDDNQADQIDVVYRVLVKNVSTNIDGRNLKNRARWRVDGRVCNSNRPTVIVRDAILEIVKGVITSTNPNAEYTDPSSMPPDSDMISAQGGDQVGFQTTLSNTGGGAAIGVVITDVTPDGLENCMIISVTDQDGNPLLYTGDLFTGGITMTNPMPPNSEIIVQTTCTIEGDVRPADLIDTEVTATWDPEPGSTTQNMISDPATIEIIKPVVTKSSISVEPGYGATASEVAIGEVLTYQAEITIPQGVMDLVIFEDILEEGLAFVQVDTVIASAGITSDALGDFSMMNQNATFMAEGSDATNQDRKLTIDFGNIFNSDTDASTTERITITYKAIVLNINSNTQGQVLDNNASWTWQDISNPGTTMTSTGSTSVTVIEPFLEISKSFLENTIDNTEETFLTLTIAHTGSSNAVANDVVVTDVLPFGMLYVDNTLGSTCPDAQLNFTNDPTPASGGTMEVAFDSLSLGEGCTVSLRVRYDPASNECEDLANCADVTWQSLHAADQVGLVNSANNDLDVERTGGATDPGESNPYVAQGCDDLYITNGLTDDPVITGTTPVCDGGATTISVVNTYSGNTVTYNWTGPNGVITTPSFELVIDPVSTADQGDYTVTVTVDGCTSDVSNIFTLIIDPKPTEPVGSTGGPYCVGDDIFLFSNPAPAGATYQWTGPNNFQSNQQNPVISNAITANDGAYYVQHIGANACISDLSNVVDVFVNPAPNAPLVSNDSPVCGQGTNDVILSATNVLTGSIVKWYNTNGQLIGQGNPLTLNNVMLTAAGDYYATVETNACVSAPSNVTTVEINEIPNESAFAGVDASYCTGTQTIMLMATAPVEGTGIWTQLSGNPVNIISPANPMSQVAGMTNGLYSFSWTLSNGVCMNYSLDIVEISIENQLSSPIASNSGAVCTGGTIELMASDGFNGETYEWTGPNGFSSTAQNPIITPATMANAGDYSVKFISTNGCESSFSVPTTVLVGEASEQAILYQANTSLCQGDTIKLFTTLTGDSYQWYGPDGANPTLTTTTSDLAIPATSAAYLAGDWRVRVVNNSGCTTELSDPEEVILNPQPITPAASISSATTCEGESIQLNAATIPNATYEWTGPFGFMTNEQSPLIINANMNNAGIYEVIAIVDACPSEPSQVELTIFENPVAVPSSNGGACGSDLELFANVNGGVAVYTYLWTGPNGFTSTDENPVILNPDSNDEGSYTVVITDATACTSEVASTQVSLLNGATFQPQITSNQPVCLGEQLTLSTQQFSGTTVNYEWTGPNNSSTSNGDYPNAATIIIENAAGNNVGDYTVTVTVDGCPSNVSPIHTVQIYSLPLANPSNNAGLNTCVDGTQDIIITANPNSGTPPYNYQWTGPNGFTSTAQNPVLNNVTSEDGGVYQLTTFDVNGCQSMTGETLVDFQDQPITPIITGNTNLCAGDRLELAIDAYPDAIYTWTFEGNLITNTSNILLVDPVTSVHNGTYAVTVEVNGCASNAAQITVNIGDAVTVEVPNQDFSCVAANQNITLSANISGGNTPYTHSWSGPNGFTSANANPTIANADASDAGTYTLQVTEAGGCQSDFVSGVISITEQPETPVITGATNYCANEKGQLEVQIYSGSNVTYVWTFNGTNLNNNNPVLVIGNDEPIVSGTYEVYVIVDGCQSVTSSISITASPEIMVTVEDQIINCVNNTTDLNLMANVSGGVTPYTYAWTGPNGFSSAQAMPIIPNAAISNAGTYNVIVSDAAGCSAPIQSSVVTITEGINQPIITSTGQVCESGDVTISVQAYSGAMVSYNWNRDGIQLFNNNHELQLTPATAQDTGFYQVVVTVDGCSASSDYYHLGVYEKPMVTIEPVEDLECTDGTENITIDATLVLPSGGGVVQYNWTGPNGYTSSIEDAIIFNAEQEDSGTYTLTVTDTNGCMSDPVSVNVLITDAITPPILTGINEGCMGETIELEVTTVIGTSTTYVWYHDQMPINNNSNELIINNATTADAGEYSVIIFAGNCSDTSNVLTVQVHENPTINIDPIAPITCTDGQQDVLITPNFSAIVSPFVFAWTGPDAYMSSDEQAEIVNATAVNSGIYNVTLTDGNGCTSTTASTTIDITDGINQPIITSSGPTCEGGEVILQIDPVSGNTVTYVWTRDGVNLNNNSPQLTLNPVTAANNGDYQVVVTADACAGASTIFALEVYENPSVTIDAILPITCSDGQQDVTFTSNITNGTAPFTYEWTGPQNFTSANANPILNNVTALNTGTYNVLVIDANGCEAATASLELEVTDGIDQPMINATGGICTGTGGLTLFTNPVSGNSVSYAWTFNGNSIANNSNELILNPATQADAGDYTVQITADGCTNASEIFTLEVNDLPQVTIANSGTFTCSDGTQSVTFDVTVTGGEAPYTYAWSGPNNFTSSLQNPTISNLTEVNAGSYTVAITDANNCGSATETVELVVSEGIAQPEVQAIGATCEGSDVILSLTTTYVGAMVTYEWRKDGVLIPNVGSTLSLNNITPSNAGLYSVEVTVDACSSLSDDYNLDINTRPQIDIAPIPAVACTDGTQDITFDVTITGGSGNNTFSWTGANNFTSTLEDPTLSNVSTANAGTYTLNVIDDNGCEAIAQSIEVEIFDGIDEPQITSSGPTCAGGDVTLQIQEYSGANVIYAWTLDGNVLNNNTHTLTLSPATLADEGDYVVLVTVNDCSENSSVYTLDIYDNPTANASSNNAPLSCADGTQVLNLMANATGGQTPYTYEWTGPNSFTSTNADPTIGNATIANAGTYTVIVTDANGCASAASSIEIEITDAPDQPLITSSGATCEGGNVTLAVVSYAGANVTYTWAKDGTAIINNSNVLEINPATIADNGDYTLTVNVDGCDATSAPFTLTTFEQTAVTISSNGPIACSIGLSDLELTSNVTAGLAPYTYAWAGPNNFVSTNANPTINNVTSLNSGTYTLIVTDANGCESENISLEVEITDGPSDPIITSTGATCEGGSITLQVSPYTGGIVQYVWSLDGVPFNVNSNELVINPANSDYTGTYSVVVTVNGCASRQVDYVLEVYANPTVFIDSNAPILCTDGTQNLDLIGTITGAVFPYTYLWGGPNNFSSTIADPTITGVTSENAGTYTLVVTDANGCQSDLATTQVLITENSNQPIITSSGPTCAGNSVTLSVESYTGTDVNYEWTLNGLAMFNNANQLIINPVSANDAGEYAVTVTVDACVATSENYTLEVYDNPTATITPVEAITCTSGNEELIIDVTAAGGNGIYTYAWTGPEGYTSTQEDAIVSNISAENAGVYTLVITDGNGCQSEAISTTIDISDGPEQPTLTSTGPVCEGGSITLTAPTYTGTSVSYEWFLNGNTLGNNSNSLTINPATFEDNGNYTLMAIVDGCEATSGAINVTIYETPEVTPDIVSPFVCIDGTEDLQLNATATLGQAASFAWTGPNGFSSSSEDPIINNITSVNTGTYCVTMTDMNGCISPAECVEVEVSDAIAQPQITTTGPVCEGGEVTLSVQTYNGTNVIYNWTKDGTALNINSAEIILSPVSIVDAGEYAVIVTVDGCSATANPYTMVVFERPTITVAPVPATICTNGEEEIILNANVTGGIAPMTFEWLGPNDFYSVNEDPVLINVNETMDGSYTVFVTDANACASNPFTIEIDITDALIEPIITSNAPTCVGEEVILEVTEYEGFDIQYEWRKDGQVLGTINNNEWTIFPATLANEGTYQVYVLVDGCENTSDEYELNLYPQPVVEIAPVAPLTCTDGNQEFTLDANLISPNNSGSYVYEWNGPNGFTSSAEDPTLVNVTTAESGTYTVIVTDANACTASASIEVDITNSIAEPVIISSGAACEGEEITLSVTGYQGTNVTYEWRKDGQLLTDITSYEYTIFPATTANAGDYGVTIFVDDCESMSDAYALEIFAQPEVEIAPIAALTCTDGNQEITLDATYTGTSTVTYEWSGPNNFTSTNEDPTLVNVTTAESGTYTVIVTDANACTASASIEVDITNSIAEPVIISSGAACEGEEITLSVTEYQGTNVTYEWRRDGQVLANANSYEYSIFPANTAIAGDYEVYVNVDGCETTSAIYTQTIFEQPAVEVAQVTPLPCSDGNQEINLDASYTGMANVTYEWTGPNGFTSTNEDPTVVNVTAANSGTYTVIVTDENGCTSDAESIEIDITDDISEATISSSGPACEGQTIVLSVPTYSGSNVTYAWQTPNNTTLNISGLNTNEITISPVNEAIHAGDYSVSITSDDCTTEADVYNVIIYESPVFTPTATTDPICHESSLELFANITAQAGNEYAWAGPNGFTSTLPNPVVNEVNTLYNGEYLLTLTTENGCSTTETIQVNNILPESDQPTIASNAPICEGDDLILQTSTSGQLFEWIGPLGNSQSTLEMAGLTTTDGTTTIPADHPSYLAGNWQVQVTDVNGCVAALSVELPISINEIPTAIATNAGAICEGTNAQLFANEIANADYEWTIAGSNEIISTLQNPIVQNVTDTTSYELTITVDGCTSEIATTTVFTLAAPTAEPFVIYSINTNCAPSDLTLNANVLVPPSGGQGLSYAWTGPNGFTSNVENPSIINATTASNGIYEVTITNTAGCSATYATNAVEVSDQLPEPIIQHSGPACQGETITLSVPQYEGSEITYDWTLNGVNITGNNQNVLIVSPVNSINEGTYGVTITIDDCIIEADAYTLDMFEQPFALPTFDLSNNCEGGTLQFFANEGNVSGDFTIEWTGPNGFSSNAPDPLIPATSIEDNGAYTVFITSESGCMVNESVVINSIIAQPTIPTILTNSSICEGEMIILSLQEQYGANATVTWFNSFGQEIGTGEVYAIADAAVGTETYLATVTIDGCTSEVATPVEVTVSAIPAATATNNGPICSNETAQLFAGTSINATYEWRNATTGELVSTDQNPMLFNIDATTTYELTVISDGCASAMTVTTTLEVNTAYEIDQIFVTAADGSQGSFCAGNDVELWAISNTTSNNIVSYTWTGPNGFSYTANTAANDTFNIILPNVDFNAEGTYQLQVTSGNGCESAVQSVLLDLNAQVQTPQVTLTEDVVCEGQMLELNATTYTGTTVSYDWYFEGELIATTNNPTYFVADVDPTNTGIYTVVANVNGCTSEVSNGEFATVYGAMTPPTATNSTSSASPACEGEIVQLEVSFFTGATYQWFGPNGFESTQFSPVISGATIDDAGNYFCVVSLNGCATVISTGTEVFISEAPNAPTIVASEAVCEGGDITFTVTSPLGTTADDDLLFTWYNAATNAVVGTSTTTEFTIENTTASQAGAYYVLYSLNGCEANEQSNLAFADITAIPTQAADAGVSETICAATSYDLNAVMPLTGSGFWTSPTGASITNPLDPASEVFNLQQGENLFVWTLSVGACTDYAADTVSINISVIPVDEANAGLDLSLCGSSDLSLNANTPIEATGEWTQPDNQASVGIVIDNPSDPNTTITGMVAGEVYSFTWSLSQGTCADYDSDEVTVTINDIPTSSAYISEDEIFACGEEEFMITAETPLFGEGIWTTSGGALIVEPSNPSSLINDLDVGVNVFYWTLSNGACESYSTDSVLIWNDVPLEANDDSYEVIFNDTIYDVDLLINDFTNSVLEWEFNIIQYPANGVVVDNGGGIIDYSPRQNFFGDDFILYEICNLNCPDMCDTARVDFHITGMDDSGDCFTPNLITPNGDGMNDALLFPCLDEYPNSHIMIFNRWGDKVYEAVPYMNDWEGTYKGSELPAGTYFFILQLEVGMTPIQHYFTIVK